MSEITSSSISDGPLTTEGIDDAAPAPGAPAEAAPGPSRFKRIAKTVGWIAFGILCLITFTLLKLPEDRIKNYVQGMIASQLAPKGITFSTERGSIAIGWGVSYVMKNVTLTFPQPEMTAKIDKVTFTPAILPMIFGYQGGTLWIHNGDGSLYASVSTKDTQVSGSFKAKAIDLGKIGLLPIAAGIRGSAVANGSGSFAGDFNLPSTLTGDVDLTLSKIALDQQSIMGFSVPKIQISEGKVEVNADKAKATIKTFKLGKPGNPADDIQATVTGDIMLGRSWNSSTLNARASFKLSETIHKSFVLIDALLGAGKQPDGSYSFNLTGPLTSPQPVPAGK